MIGSGIWSDIPRMDVVVFNKVSGKAGLTEMNGYFIVVPRNKSTVPRKSTVTRLKRSCLNRCSTLGSSEK